MNPTGQMWTLLGGRFGEVEILDGPRLDEGELVDVVRSPPVEFTENQVKALLWAVKVTYESRDTGAASGDLWEALKHAATKLEEVLPFLEGPRLHGLKTVVDWAEKHGE